MVGRSPTPHYVDAMRIRHAIYSWYARRLRAQLARGVLPRHVAMVMDGNRRWARQQGLASASLGYRHGAEHVEDVLGWCADAGISDVTLFVVSADNLRKRSAEEMRFLMDVIERATEQILSAADNPWQIHVTGRLDLLPDSTAHALKAAQDETPDRDTGLHLTVAVGYDGRAEITDAVRSMLDQAARSGVSLPALAARLTENDIAEHLPTFDRPDPDLVIRTSGEHRLSGFLLWQATHSELYFCDVYWPGFRHVDFLRALRAYAARKAPQVALTP